MFIVDLLSDVLSRVPRSDLAEGEHVRFGSSPEERDLERCTRRRLRAGGRADTGAGLQRRPRRDRRRRFRAPYPARLRRGEPGTEWAPRLPRAP
jgi:hypothetical protein